MIVVVTGGRDYQDLDVVYRTLDAIHAETPIRLLVEGGALGADRLAYQWALSRGVIPERVEADWKTHGKMAGPIRNREMLERFAPDLVVAFPGGRGTANCKSEARKRGIKVLEVTE